MLKQINFKTEGMKSTMCVTTKDAEGLLHSKLTLSTGHETSAKNNTDE